MNICVYGSANDDIDSAYIEAGEQLGELMAEAGYGLVYGGGGHGLMGAVARGVHRKGGYILGVAPTFFDPMDVYFPDCTEFKSTITMRERKQHMEDNSQAFIVTPGGLGTFDEFIEMLSLKALGRHQKPIAVLNTKGYYDTMTAWLREAAEKGFINLDKCNDYFVSEDPREILDYIKENA